MTIDTSKVGNLSCGAKGGIFVVLWKQLGYSARKTNMTMENHLKMYPLLTNDFPASHVSFLGCICFLHCKNFAKNSPLNLEFSTKVVLETTQRESIVTPSSMVIKFGLGA